jgi:hypothetical protein
VKNFEKAKYLKIFFRTLIATGEPKLVIPKRSFYQVCSPQLPEKYFSNYDFMIMKVILDL